jgi:hypothetical protein
MDSAEIGGDGSAAGHARHRHEPARVGDVDSRLMTIAMDVQPGIAVSGWSIASKLSGTCLLARIGWHPL